MAPWTGKGIKVREEWVFVYLNLVVCCCCYSELLCTAYCSIIGPPSVCLCEWAPWFVPPAASGSADRSSSWPVIWSSCGYDRYTCRWWESLCFGSGWSSPTRRQRSEVSVKKTWCPHGKSAYFIKVHLKYNSPNICIKLINAAHYFWDYLTFLFCFGKS